MKRKRKIRTFTLSDKVYQEFRGTSRNMSRDIEAMLKRHNEDVRKIARKKR